MARFRLASCVLALVALAPSAARPGPLTQDACPTQVPTQTSEFHRLGNNVLENLLFAYGSLWVSDGTAGMVRRFDHVRTEGAGRSVSSPGGLTLGPDGLIYAGAGNSLGNAITRSGQAKVVRFDVLYPAAPVSEYAAGFNMPNGMTWHGDDLFISNDFDRGLVRIPREPDGSAGQWHQFSDVWGTNGLVIHGGSLYAAITFDQRSPIERISLVNGSHETAAQLSFGVLSLEPNVYPNPDTAAPLLGVKGLDDMTGDGRYLYPVANGTGELLRVDPSTGAACLITGGLQNPSSVRIAPAGSAFDTDADPATVDFYVTEFSGRIMHVVFDPA